MLDEKVFDKAYPLDWGVMKYGLKEPRGGIPIRSFFY
jgi:hypothetical protein